MGPALFGGFGFLVCTGLPPSGRYVMFSAGPEKCHVLHLKKREKKEIVCSGTDLSELKLTEAFSGIPIFT
jgi:hypothetical protein